MSSSPDIFKCCFESGHTIEISHYVWALPVDLWPMAWKVPGRNLDRFIVFVMAAKEHNTNNSYIKPDRTFWLGRNEIKAWQEMAATFHCLPAGGIGLLVGHVDWGDRSITGVQILIDQQYQMVRPTAVQGRRGLRLWRNWNMKELSDFDLWAQISYLATLNNTSLKEVQKKKKDQASAPSGAFSFCWIEIWFSVWMMKRT